MTDETTTTTTTEPTTTTQAPTAAPWYGADASGDIKGFVELKGWDSPVKAIDGYRNLEKLVGAGAERAVIWPKDEADAEGWKAINAKLGVPETPEGYKLTPPEGDDGSFAKAAAPALHKLGITAKQAEGLQAFLNEQNTAAVAAYDAQMQADVERQQAELKTEWGAQHDQNKQIAKRAALAMGFDEATINALEQSVGYKAVMSAMLKVGQKIGEDKFVQGGEPAGRNFTPEGAKARLDQLKKDSAWVSRLLAGDVAAIEERDRLNANLAGMNLNEYRQAKQSFG